MKNAPWILWLLTAVLVAALVVACGSHKSSSSSGVVAETVWTDPTTGHMWQVTPTSADFTWADAQSYCADLTYAGYADWELPDLDALRSLIRGCSATQSDGECGLTDSCLNESCLSDSCAGCAAGGPGTGGCFQPPELGATCSWYWSSSGLADRSHFATGVYFGAGYVFLDADRVANQVRCMR